MKRFFIIVTALLIAVMTALSGCSCSMPVQLDFTQDFSGNGTTFAPLSSSYTEELTYKVERIEKYGTSITTSQNIPASAIRENFISGQYTMKFYGDVSRPQIENGLVLQNDSNLHFLKTELALTVKIDDQTTYNDLILTDVYFYSAGSAYAPLYVRQTIKNTLFAFDYDKNQLIPSIVIYDYTTVYGQSSYNQIKKTYKKISPNELKDVDIRTATEQDWVIESNSTYGYSVAQLIDNSQLYFLMRNMPIKKDETKTLPTVSPVYGVAQSLAIKNLDKNSANYQINYNGTQKNLSLEVNNYAFNLNSTYNSGTAQYAIYQAQMQNSELPFRAFPLEFVQTITEYKNLGSLGALKFTITDISLSN